MVLRLYFAINLLLFIIFAIMIDNENILKYINDRYCNWYAYTVRYCEIMGRHNEARDILHESIISIFEKKKERIDKLYNKKGRYREIDFFILSIIKRNVVSKTSCYHYMYRSVPIEDNVNFEKLDIEYDFSEDNFNIDDIRCIFDKINLTQVERDVFDFKFFKRNSFKDWTGNESIYKLYLTYNIVVNSISQILALLGYSNVVRENDRYSINGKKRIKTIVSTYFADISSKK